MTSSCEHMGVSCMHLVVQLKKACLATVIDIQDCATWSPWHGQQGDVGLCIDVQCINSAAIQLICMVCNHHRACNPWFSHLCFASSCCAWSKNPAAISLRCRSSSSSDSATARWAHKQQTTLQPAMSTTPCMQLNLACAIRLHDWVCCCSMFNVLPK